MLARRLLIAGGGGSFLSPAAQFPTAWNITREATNPVIDVANNPSEATEQYTPAPIQLPSGDVWVYVKGGSTIYAWKSTNGGVTFALQNGGTAVLVQGAGGSWDESFVVEPAALYDEATDTIHLWYGGRGAGANTWAWGHATAPGSTPTVFTKDAANPILTSATVSTALGGLTVSDLKISAPIIVGSVYHFYGYTAYNSRYKLIHLTGTTWNDPTGVGVILTAANDNEVVQCPSVVRMPGSGVAIYAMLWTIGGPQPDPRWIRAASSSDAIMWDFSDTTNIMSPTSGWEVNEVYAAAIMKTPAGAPLTVGGYWMFYYSGLGGGKASSGLARMSPA